MKPTALWWFVLVGLGLSGCDRSPNGRYVPVSSANSVFLVDTQNGRMYKLPPQYRDGADPTPAPPAKWSLVGEF